MTDYSIITKGDEFIIKVNNKTINGVYSSDNNLERLKFNTTDFDAIINNGLMNKLLSIYQFLK